MPGARVVNWPIIIIHYTNTGDHYQFASDSSSPSLCVYLFVVIQHCVHVLNPDGINWTVKNEPLSVRTLRVSKSSVADG